MRDPQDHQVLAGDYLVMGAFRFRVVTLSYVEFIDEMTRTEGATLNVICAPCVSAEQGGV